MCDIPVAYAQWMAMMVVGVEIGLLISGKFALAGLALWVMGCLYNIPPVRTKDVPYLDVLTESINNPLRMLLGWYAVTSVLVPPVSLLMCVLDDRLLLHGAEAVQRAVGDWRPKRGGGVPRVSFKRYTPESLLVSVVFYASTAMLFFGAFIIRYRIELILGFRWWR